ncbi:MAG: tetratricopeptide repeat protein [Bdellovibrionaceae bacterium]|nr:tetratricopeptide repeat protein [Bdellovibrio sp.]
MKLKLAIILLLAVSFTACLKTRAEMGEEEQSQVYQRKNVDNQKEAAKNSQISSKGQATSTAIDERDDTIRTLNGRVESLENQINSLQKEKSATSEQETQRLQLLQEALAKMEAQIHKLESEQALNNMAAPRAEPSAPPTKAHKMNSSDKNAAIEKGSAASGGATGPYDNAQDFFMKKEWKKAILNYQKYVDESPKGKNVADAKYKIGVCFQELGMKEESMAFYEEVIANYAKSDAGKKSKIRLAKLKK